MSVFGDPLLSRLASPFEAANDAEESTSRPTPRVFIKSFGCQMNVYDSQRMADLAVGEGYTETQTIADADLVVLNTCHIRERASEKVFSELGQIRELKERRAAAGLETTLVVAGCVAQAEGAGNPAPPARRRYRRGSAKLSSAAEAVEGRARVWIPSFRSRTSSIIFRPVRRRPSAPAA